jgi:hypothetical protein
VVVVVGWVIRTPSLLAAGMATQTGIGRRSSWLTF